MEPKKHQLAIVKNDPWLEPVEQLIEDRYNRYKSKLAEIKEQYGSLAKFADAHNYLGINYDAEQNGWYYREWAPNANALFLVGDFNDWNRSSHPLHRIDNGVWEIFLDKKSYEKSFVHNSKFKVLVHAQNGARERIPAYSRRVVQDDYTKNFSSQLWFPEKFDWSDDDFTINKHKHLFIYETHVGMAQEKEGVGIYIEFEEKILPKVKAAGYNAIQVMAIAEHPYYGSFGYHVANFFAPSSRFGTPEELKSMIKKAHSMDIAVIMDIVHSHTVKNINEGISEFDGTEGQYFHSGGRGEHPDWDSKLFDYGKTEVQQFLLSNIKYWLQEFHFDGFRFDGVSSMLYFHHGHTTFDSQEKYFSDGVEWDAITYLQLANKLIHNLERPAVSIAEDVSGMPGLTNKISDGGIGFDYRLAMGIPDYWIKIMKEKKDEDWDIYEMWNVLTDRKKGVGTISYAESHDQALVGDKTLAFWLMDKEMYYNMHRDSKHFIIERGIALHKMFRLFTIALAGNAYMNFMGNEFGHPEWIDFPREGNNWSHKHARRMWSLTENKDLKYHYLSDFDAKMIEIVKGHKIFNHEFARQINMDGENKTIVFERKNLIFVFNFHPNNSIPDYMFPVRKSGEYRLLLNSDDAEFGGYNRTDASTKYFTIKKEGEEGNFLSIYNTNRTALVFIRNKNKKNKKKK